MRVTVTEKPGFNIDIDYCQLNLLSVDYYRVLTALATKMPKFVIPQRDDDLLEASEGVFHVSELVTETDDIVQSLNRFQSLVNKQEFEQLEEYFDEFFAVARHNEEISFDLKYHAFDILAKGLSNFTPPLRNHVSDVINSTLLTDELSELNEKYRNCLLMYIYLLSRISHQIEAYVSKKTRSVNADQKGKKAAADPSEDSTVSSWNSQDGRLRLLRLLFGITTIEAVHEDGPPVRAGIKFLFTPNILDEQLVECVLKIVMKILENPEASKASGKNILIASFHVLRAVCIGWEQSNIVAMLLMELAAGLEYFQKPGVTTFHFVDCILMLQTKDELRPLLSEMIKYLGKFDPQSFAGDTSAKAFCLFITTMAEKDPTTLLKNMAPLMAFLSYDPPTLRNAMLTAFADIASKCSDDENENQSFEKQRRAMLTRLQDHIQDTAAVVRTRILHVWEKLATKQAIPNEQFRFLLVTDIGNRLKDSSVMVRKAAALIYLTKKYAGDS
uniref:Condensin complex subunit 1 N-terminal domain-containing protein n=1 Tax=Ditylenchus dipsaci TaxID=166011 RepID=A0A915D6C5_9BILA